MIDIRNLEPSDISYIMGLWQAYMGGQRAHALSGASVAAWFHELKSGGPYVVRELDSRWHAVCDICLAVELTGGVYAFCYEATSICTNEEKDALSSARAFEAAVRSIA